MMFENVVGIVLPLLIHFIVSCGVVAFGGSKFDAAFLTAVAALIVLPIFSWMFKKDRQRFGISGNEKNMSLWTYPAIVFTAVISNQILSYLITLLTSNYDISNAAQESLFGSSLWAQILGIGLIVPIMEELLFRGLVYKRLKRFVKFKAAVFLGAFIFAFYHGNLIQFLFAFPMALLLIWVYEKCETIKAPILFHIAVNLSSVLMSEFL